MFNSAAKFNGTGDPIAASRTIARTICGAATLVPFIAIREPLRVPAPRIPSKVRDVSERADAAQTGSPAIDSAL